MFVRGGDIPTSARVRHVAAMNEQITINWYRTPVDKAVMSRLMKRSDAKGMRHCLLHLGLFAATTAASYLAYQQIDSANWIWSVPLLLLCLFVHGTFASFFGGLATHELCHKTPFQNQKLNDLFLRIFSFLSWFDWVGYRLSHVKHHQVTVHHNLDGEVILPHKLDWMPVEDDEPVLPTDGKLAGFLAAQFLPFPNPLAVWQRLTLWTKYALGRLDGLGMFAGGVWWMGEVLPENKTDSRIRHRNWARVVLGGHLLLAIALIATGHGFLIIPLSLSGTYAGWLASLCALPQHMGMGPDVPDFRLCCRTFTCNRFLGFLYWNMQYHVEHHMFPAVPFYNLPALRAEIQHDLPPAPHGLWATWREIVPILRRQSTEPDYFFVPTLPSHSLVEVSSSPRMA
jgi:fatty acid desaturase